MKTKLLMILFETIKVITTILALLMKLLGIVYAKTIMLMIAVGRKANTKNTK